MSNTQLYPQTATRNDRLEQLLKAFGHAATDSHPCFAERLGRLFGLGDTMDLDSALAFRAKGDFQADPDSIDKLKNDLDVTRSKLVDRLHQSFTNSDANAGPSLPQPDLDERGEQPPAFTPYQDFYLARQRELAAGTRQLRTRVRNVIATASPTMAHLVKLDTVFDHTLAGYTSQSFATLPTLLEKRFHTLWQGRQQMTFDQQDHDPAQCPVQDWIKPGGWLHQYCQEMQMLLLAELEVRLEPVIGLLDAFTNEVRNTP